MSDLQQKFIAHWKARSLGGSNKRPMLLALSGGLDSMALAHLLLDADISFASAHCNFGLRGAASDEDAVFVHAWCAASGIACHLQTFDTAAIAAQRGQSIQMAARMLRYDWFEALRQAQDYSGILTAHHADDVAETVLINLCRGAGIAGLHGIPERNGAIIRPLLFASRADINAFAAAQKITWREDASNATTDYLRNALRHEVLPKLDQLMPGAAMRIADTAVRVGEAEAIYRIAVKQRLARLMEQRGQDWYVPVRLLEKTAELNTIAYELFTPFGFRPEQISHVLRLMHSESGRAVSSATHRVIRNRDFLILTSAEHSAADFILIDEIPKNIETADGSYAFSWEEPSGKLPDAPDTACFHGDDLALPLILRTRREGDYFYPLGMGGKKKKLKRFLIDMKIPVHEKDRIRILESGKKILWIVCRRIDERFKVRPSTQRMLKVVFKPA